MKQRKTTVLPFNERCIAIINNGKQCSRRRKYGSFCGKHNKKQQYGVISNNIVSKLTKDTLIQVRTIEIEQKRYLIDQNKILFNESGTTIIGKLKDDGIIYI